MRIRAVVLSCAAVTLLGCGASSPSGTSTASTASSPSAAPVTATTSVAPEQTASATAPSSACLLDAESTDWAPVAESGRCLVTVFTPPMSFDASPGWFWGGSADRWAMTRDNGAFTFLSIYRYGGAVVPAYCEDPPPTIEMSAGSEIVAWLETVEDLDVEMVGRSVGPYPAWQLDLRSHVPSCSGDPGKSGLASLWTIDGQPVELPQTLSQGDRMLAYLVELPSLIVVMTASKQPIEDMPGIPDNRDFFERVEAIFSTLQFE